MPATPNHKNGAMAKEPSAIIGAITAAVSAIISLLVAFGLDLSPDQQAAILTVIATVGSLVVGFVVRGQVYSPNSVERITKEAAATGHAEVPPPPAN